MSTSYRTRLKAIRDYKLKNPEKLNVFGQIPANDFYTLQANWHRKVTGPPLGSLDDIIKAQGRRS